MKSLHRGVVEVCKLYKVNPCTVSCSALDFKKDRLAISWIQKPKSSVMELLDVKKIKYSTEIRTYSHKLVTPFHFILQLLHCLWSQQGVFKQISRQSLLDGSRKRMEGSNRHTRTTQPSSLLTRGGRWD